MLPANIFDGGLYADITESIKIIKALTDYIEKEQLNRAISVINKRKK